MNDVYDDDLTLRALALIEMSGQPISPDTIDDMRVLLGLDPSRLAVWLAALVRSNLEASGTDVQAWCANAGHVHWPTTRRAWHEDLRALPPAPGRTRRLPAAVPEMLCTRGLLSWDGQVDTQRRQRQRAVLGRTVQGQRMTRHVSLRSIAERLRCPDCAADVFAVETAPRAYHMLVAHDDTCPALDIAASSSSYVTESKDSEHVVPQRK